MRPKSGKNLRRWRARPARVEDGNHEGSAVSSPKGLDRSCEKGGAFGNAHSHVRREAEWRCVQGVPKSRRFREGVQRGEEIRGAAPKDHRHDSNTGVVQLDGWLQRLC